MLHWLAEQMEMTDDDSFPTRLVKIAVPIAILGYVGLLVYLVVWRIAG